MHVGKSYRVAEFLHWTRQDIYLLIVMGVMPVVLYQVAGLKWLGIPWTVVALLGGVWPAGCAGKSDEVPVDPEDTDADTDSPARACAPSTCVP